MGRLHLSDTRLRIGPPLVGVVGRDDACDKGVDGFDMGVCPRGGGINKGSDIGLATSPAGVGGAETDIESGRWGSFSGLEETGLLGLGSCGKRLDVGIGGDWVVSDFCDASDDPDDPD